MLQLPERISDTLSDFTPSFSFQPIAVETLGPVIESAVDFLCELGCRISSEFQEKRQTADPWCNLDPGSPFCQ